MPIASISASGEHAMYFVYDIVTILLFLFLLGTYPTYGPISSLLSRRLPDLSRGA